MDRQDQASPLTSIVMVTYNRLDQTRACLDSVVSCTPEPYELLFVDNASSDDTVSYLRERFGAEAVMANGSNEGFIKGANRGMAAARGQYVLLLNNDTIVTPGWLGALIATAEGWEKAGIVGGKILGPDGRVQVAGAYMAFDGSARMMGEGLSSDDPSLSRAREVCYVGGHCMLIKREVMDTVGLLDEGYGFGYHEDTDYCYKARAAGFQVVYTPDCVVHHQLFGTPLPERQRIIADNQRLFLDRWEEVLFLRRFLGPRIEFRADRGELPLGAGWSAAETDYTCMAADAWCCLECGGNGAEILEVVAAAPHPDLAERPLHLEVYIGDLLVGHGFFRTPWDVQQLFFPVPAGCHDLRVRLKVDRTWRPDELFQDGRDPREIGLAVHRIAAGTASEARDWAAKGVPREASLQRLQDHLEFLERAVADKDAFYRRELEGKERLIARLQGNLERYHATLPFRAYFALKHLAGKNDPA